jgi:hypothetical protein
MGNNSHGVNNELIENKIIERTKMINIKLI